MIEVAQQEHSDLTVEEVEESISTDLEGYREQMKARLRNREREQVEYGPMFERDEVVKQAQSAVAESIIGFSAIQK